MFRRRAIMVCAVKQHTGKTSVSMALLSNLKKLAAQTGHRVGYMKPVGQQWVAVKEDGVSVRVDKDAALAHDYFKLADPISCVSPIVIGRGDTKAFLDGTMPDLADDVFASRIMRAYDAIASSNDFVVVEGTGHCGVGSVLGWNNARVAATIGVDILLVANGGIGSSFDELALNVIACREARANIAGIIINKCAPHKVHEVFEYLQRASDKFGWNVPVLACVPYGEDLDKPSVADLVTLFGGSNGGDSGGGRYDPSARSTNVANMRSSLRASSWDEPDFRKGQRRVLMAGNGHLHKRFSHYELVTTSLERFMEKLAGGEGSELERFTGKTSTNAADHESGRVCFVTHISRSDIIQGLLGHRAMIASTSYPGETPPFGGGLIVAGAESHSFEPFVNEYIRMADIPVVRSFLDMSHTMAAMRNLTPKMQAGDKHRVENVIDLYAPHLEEAVRRIVSGE